MHHKISHLLGVASIAGIGALTLQGVSYADSFYAPLVECSLVTQPKALTGCGSDPIGRGTVSIQSDGDVTIDIRGAGASAAYSAVFRAPTGSGSTTLGTVNTDAKGNGQLHKHVALALGQVGAGNVVLTRSGSDQYVSGFSVTGGAGFRPSLVTCSTVNNPGGLSNCGTDTLKNGDFGIEGDDGDLEISLSGAAASVTYAVVLRPSDGSADQSIASINTDAKGRGKLSTTSAFSGVGSGTVILTRSGADQFLSGFAVTQKPTPPILSKSSLVQCASLTLPALSSCGTDPLNSGSVSVDQSSKLQALLRGAAPATKYEVFLRPIDNSGDIDTGLTLTTDKNGNARGSTSYPPSGSVASGNFVVKQFGTTVDQYLTGFAVK